MHHITGPFNWKDDIYVPIYFTLTVNFTVLRTVLYMYKYIALYVYNSAVMYMYIYSNYSELMYNVEIINFIKMTIS